jgi:SAM-dependent methyltransferase
MPAILIDELLADLRCPRCAAAVTLDADTYRCTACGNTYTLAGGQPVLVDFDQSILVEEELTARSAESPIERGRGGGLKRRVTRAMLGSNRVAPRNAARFLELARDSSARPRILIIGGGSAGEGTEQLYNDPSVSLISFDIFSSELTQFVADAHRIPLADASVDAVWIQAVLEHVLDPWQVASEIHRVLKPRGIVYAETPFLQQVHEGAYDFTRFTESGHRWLFLTFEAIDSGVVLGPGSQLLWSIEHVVRGTFRSVTAAVLVKMLLFWLRYFDALIPERYASDAASAVYFLGRKSETAIQPRDMIAYYKGAHARTK